MLFLEHSHDHDEDAHDDHGGLHRDLFATDAAMNRRGMLRMAARMGVALGALPLLGCGGDASTLAGVDTSGTSTTGAGGACPSKIPNETEGPYPGDGSNGPNVLSQSGIVRSDIRSSFAGLSGTAVGVPLTIQLTLVSASTCSPLADYAVYLWHCDRGGNYSLYSSGYTNQNWLRGVQAADANGIVTFTSIYPGCYAGRWPHIHFEIFSSLSGALGGNYAALVSQLAMPTAACTAVYADTTTYPSSATNLARISLSSDNVFGDNTSAQIAQQTPTLTGGPSSGYTGTAVIGLAR